jgi:hypothetical protein
MVVNASLRSHIIHHDQSGFHAQITIEKGGENNNIHNVVNNGIKQ